MNVNRFKDPGNVVYTSIKNIRSESACLQVIVIICSTCTRPMGKSCLYPDMLRYSIESLGGDVVKTAENLLESS